MLQYGTRSKGTETDPKELAIKEEKFLNLQFK